MQTVYARSKNEIREGNLLFTQILWITQFSTSTLVILKFGSVLPFLQLAFAKMAEIFMTKQFSFGKVDHKKLKITYGDIFAARNRAGKNPEIRKKSGWR